jgi:hypothetical protein
MASRERTPALLLVLAMLGCKGAQPTSAASGAADLGVAVSGAASTGGTRTENIVDPTMDNKVAYYVTIPANWKFKGILLQGGVATCQSYAYESYRVTSEDGQSFDEIMPQLLWAYGDGPKPKMGCLPIDKPMSAQDFLKYLSTTMLVAYSGDTPMSDGLAKVVKQLRDSYAQPAPFYAQRNLPPPHNTADGAAALVRYKQNGVAMEGRLETLVTCMETQNPGFHSILAGMPSKPATTSGKCTAGVGFVSAPENQFAAVLRMWENPALGAQQNKEWGDAWVKRYAEQGQAVNDAIIHRADEKFAAQRAEIAHTMAVQQAVHDQFLQTMQEGTDRSMAHAAEVANSNHRAAQDMVDYSLDRQTVLDPETGNYFKVTNQLTTNGTLIRAHGDGSPW